MRNIFVICSVFLFLGAASAQEVQRTGSHEYVSVSANEFCDRIIQLLTRKFIEIGLDPLFTPQMEFNETFNWLFEEHVMNIKLDNGTLMGLSAMDRGGDCLLNYDLRLLLVTVNIHLPILTGQLPFDITVLGFNPEGILDVKVTDEHIEITLLLDLKTTTISLQELKVSNTGILDLDASGMGLLGTPLANLVLSVVQRVFKDKIMQIIEDTASSVISSILDQIGAILGEIPDDGQIVNLLMENVNRPTFKPNGIHISFSSSNN